MLNIKNKKGILLAYDHGLEHGPFKDFKKSIHSDPKYIISLAEKAKVDGIIFQPGIAEKYNEEIKKSKIPLIIKINGKTSLSEEKYFSALTATPQYAKDLGAIATGYTIYFGSYREWEMIQTYTKIKEESKKLGMSSILWSYVRSKKLKHDTKKQYVGYAARAGMELGADIIKIKYPGKKELKEILSYVHKTKVFIAGGSFKSNIIDDIKDMFDAGAHGIAIGRNIWQRDDALELLREIKKL